ncbi:MAG: penicillin-binding protein activator [Alphaproteobacteria bacterium]|nr:penicillin-binding protein activator [Alphaproteobacteria bacterium]
MHIIIRLFGILTITALFAGCSGGGKWRSDSSDIATSMPATMQYGGFSTGMYGTSGAHRIAVLLPTSGKNAPVGQSIRNGIEIAAMQFAPNELEINFYDTAVGESAIERALASNPEIIIGPLFADNARILRDRKSSDIPALSFTSDISAVGDGVFSMSIMPTNSIESLIKQMRTYGAKRFITFAPNTPSGQTMAGAAQSITGIYDINNIGIFYYDEHNTESIKSAAMSAAMYDARSAANTRAKEILSAILNHEKLNAVERSSVIRQLENLKRTDTLGDLPYDSVLFLGSGEDTRSIASFLRYYGLGTRDAKFYGTPMWQQSDMKSDITMTGAEFANLPEYSNQFSTLYESATGQDAPRMAAIGYDAAILAMGALYSSNDMGTYLTSPSGYTGMNGLFRLKSNGSNERALDIVRLNGDGTVSVVKNAETNFMTPIYATNLNRILPAEPMPLATSGINPLNYIKIPDRLRSKYRTKTYGTTSQSDENDKEVFSTTTVEQNQDNESITASDYQSVPLETVGRTYIDSVEISE